MSRGLKASRNLRALEDRADFLRDKIGRQDYSPAALSYAEGELLALDFAIEVLRDLAEREANDPENVVRQRWQAQWQATAVRALYELGQFDPAKADRLLSKGPEGIRALYGRECEQREFGRAVPRADDTRKRRFT